jgi:hypothetical protein
MAQPITSLLNSDLPKFSVAEFYSNLRHGDLIFCQGNALISNVIEKETNSPLSHVLMAWLPSATSPWLLIEAVIDKGVHVGLVDDYVQGYNGYICIARRPKLTIDHITASLNAGFALLDSGYNWQTEISIAGSKLLDKIPILNEKREFYCSGLMYAMSLATPYPLQKPNSYPPTPIQNWLDPTVEAVGVLIK